MQIPSPTGPSHSIFDRFNNVQSLEITSPFFLIIIIIIITMIALLSVSVGRFWQVCICVALEPWVYACVCECYVKPFQRDRFDSWLHFSLAHKEYKQTQIMVSTLDSITSLCWCYMLFSRSGIFAHFVFHAHKYMYFCCFFLSFSLTLLQLLLFRFDLSAFGYWSIWIYVWVVCVRAFLSISFKFSHCFWCAFGWTGVKRILFVRRLHGLAFFVCVVVCWPTFWEWQQSTTSIMHTKSSVNSFWNKKSIGNFFDFFCVSLTQNTATCTFLSTAWGCSVVHHPFEMQTS